MSKTTAEGRGNRAARAYLAALDRLIEGKATHPDHAGRPVRITPAAVAREARRSRNPLYTTHRAMLGEIEAAASRPTTASDLGSTVARLEASNAELRRIIQQLQNDKRNLATENLALLHRARLAEDRLASRDRELASLKRKSGALAHRNALNRPA
jgi:predicted RNase H-like nuclease (RuvC/YqgF family)